MVSATRWRKKICKECRIVKNPVGTQINGSSTVQMRNKVLFLDYPLYRRSLDKYSVQIEDKIKEMIITVHIYPPNEEIVGVVEQKALDHLTLIKDAKKIATEMLYKHWGKEIEDKFVW